MINHQMNYYDYGKNLDIQGVIPIMGGGVSPEQIQNKGENLPWFQVELKYDDEEMENSYFYITVCTNGTKSYTFTSGIKEKQNLVYTGEDDEKQAVAALYQVLKSEIVYKRTNYIRQYDGEEDYFPLEDGENKNYYSKGESYVKSTNMKYYRGVDDGENITYSLYMEGLEGSIGEADWYVAYTVGDEETINNVWAYCNDGW